MEEWISQGRGHRRREGKAEKIALLGAGGDTKFRKSFSLEARRDSQVGGNQSEQSRGRPGRGMSGSALGMAPEHFGLFLLEQSMEFSLGKGPELAEGQVCHDQPLVFHPPLPGLPAFGGMPVAPARGASLL